MIGNTRNSKLTEPKFHGILNYKQEVERCRVAEKYTITPLSELPLHNDFMFSQVMRVIEKDDGSFEYGCSFLELTEEDQEKITQNIFAVQRQNRARS